MQATALRAAPLPAMNGGAPCSASCRRPKFWPALGAGPASVATHSLRNADGSDTVYGFQCNERFLEWDASAARGLLRLFLSRELGIEIEHVNAKLLELSALLPDLIIKLENLKASLVLELCQDTEGVAKRMLALREALPDVNVSAMVSGNLWLLKEPSEQSLRDNLQTMR